MGLLTLARRAARAAGERLHVGERGVGRPPRATAGPRRLKPTSDDVPPMALSDLADEFEAHPVLTTLTLGSLAGAVLMVALTVVLVPLGIGPETRPAWAAVVAIGVLIVGVWNVAYPVWDRFAAHDP